MISVINWISWFLFCLFLNKCSICTDPYAQGLYRCTHGVLPPCESPCIDPVQGAFFFFKSPESLEVTISKVPPHPSFLYVRRIMLYFYNDSWQLWFSIITFINFKKFQRMFFKSTVQILSHQTLSTNLVNHHCSSRLIPIRILETVWTMLIWTSATWSFMIEGISLLFDDQYQIAKCVGTWYLLGFNQPSYNIPFLFLICIRTLYLD